MMWKLIKISQETYFIHCNFNSAQNGTFILYDLKTAWSQVVPLQEIKQKVKVFNKRFDFNEDNIKEALSSGVIQSALLEDEPNTSAMNVDRCLLKLKYRVKNCILNYEWNLEKQDFVEFQQVFVQPLLLALLDSHQQVEIMTDTIRKKDEELKQFRIEGAELNRRTLITKPFDFDSFTKKYEYCNKTAEHFREVAKYIREIRQEESKRENEELGAHNVKATEPEGNMKNSPNEKTKMSPKQKKRKANELKMEQFERHLRIRRAGIQYESSQSQTLSSGNSQTTENGNQLTQNNNIQNALVEIENVPSSSKSSKSAPVREKNDGEDHLKTLRKRKLTRNSVNPTKLNEKRNAGDTTQKSTENVFDFSTESDSDVPLLKRRNSLKNKSQDDMPLAKRKKLLTRERLSVNKDCSSINATSPVLHCITVDSVISMQPLSESKNLNDTQTPVIVQEISLQLDNIRKELECLEAMRLADLKQRTCKV